MIAYQFSRVLLKFDNDEGSLSGAMVNNPPANAGDARNAGSIPVLGRCSGVRNGNSFQYSCMENSMDRGAWQATVHRVTRVRHDLATKPPSKGA